MSACDIRLWPPEVSRCPSRFLLCAVRSRPLGGAPSTGPHRGSDGRMAEAGGPESAAARCPDESSDSEPEQEPGTPQKLIRKVSTSGQIRSKVKIVKNTGVYQRTRSVVSVCFHSAGVGHTQPRGARLSALGGQRYAELHSKLCQIRFQSVTAKLYAVDAINLRRSLNEQAPLCNTACTRHTKHLLFMSYVIFYNMFDSFCLRLRPRPR